VGSGGHALRSDRAYPLTNGPKPGPAKKVTKSAFSVGYVVGALATWPTRDGVSAAPPVGAATAAMVTASVEQSLLVGRGDQRAVLGALAGDEQVLKLRARAMTWSGSVGAATSVSTVGELRLARWASEPYFSSESCGSRRNSSYRGQQYVIGTAMTCFPSAITWAPAPFARRARGDARRATSRPAGGCV
jgi:hypothetical protein